MGDDWDEEVADATAAAPASGFVEVASADVPEIKLFGKWSCDEVNVSDMSLQDYIACKEKFAKFLPHSSGRYAAKRFRKAQCPVVERLVRKQAVTVVFIRHSGALLGSYVNRSIFQLKPPW